MKKLFALLLAGVLLFCAAACISERQPTDAEPDEIEDTGDVGGEDLPEPDEELDDQADVLEMCECGEHYIGEPLRQPTPPMNIHEILSWQMGVDEFPYEEHEANILEFVRDFENVHTFTYTQFETDTPGTIVLWSDVPLYDFSFVSLDVANHYWEDDDVFIIDTLEVLLTIPELLPTDAVVLNIAFDHYLYPHGAIIFTDQNGTRQRMFIVESMRGGCDPLYHLGQAHELPN